MVWDAPAHGKSRPFTLCFTMEDMADYLKQILEREGIFSPVLVGQSLGGYISQVYMQRYPKSVSGFVSIDSCPLKRKYYTGAELLMLKHTKWMYRSIPWKMLLKFGTEGTSETKYGRKLMVRMMLSFGKKEYCDLADHGFRIFAQAVRKSFYMPVHKILSITAGIVSCFRYPYQHTVLSAFPVSVIPFCRAGSILFTA